MRCHIGSHTSSVNISNCLDWLVQCSVENAAVCEEEEEEDFGRLATFSFDTFTMLFSTTGCVVCHETLEDER